MIDIETLNKAIALTQKGYVKEAENVYLSLLEKNSEDAILLSALGLFYVNVRDFEKAIIECAAEIAKVPSMDMLQYVQKEVWLSGDGIDYQRVVGLLKNCMEWLDEDISSVGDTLEAFYHMGFKDNEIEELGYGWLFEEEEK